VGEREREEEDDGMSSCMYMRERRARKREVEVVIVLNLIEMPAPRRGTLGPGWGGSAASSCSSGLVWLLPQAAARLHVCSAPR